MKIFTLIFALILVWTFGLCAEENVSYPNIISAKYVNRSVIGNQVRASITSSVNKASSSHLTPKIHQNIWPDFCLNHLWDNPEGCSAWGEENQVVDLELLLYGYSHAHIDRALIERLGHLIYLIPLSHDPMNPKHQCAYGTCTQCHQDLFYGVCCSDENYDEDDPQSYDYSLLKGCDCDKKYKWVESGVSVQLGGDNINV